MIAHRARASRLLMAALPFALVACASTGAGSAGKAAPPAQGVIAAPAQGPRLPEQAQRPRTSPYAPAQEDLSKRGNYVAGGLYAPGVPDTVPDDIPDVDAIPEPEVRVEPRARTGNRGYSVLGKRYSVLDSDHGYVEQGGASYYGKKFHGRRTSSGEVYDMYAFTAAHKTLPLPSYARVTNLDNGKSVVVKINDRGPFHPGRVIDLSYAAAVKLGYREKGVARVEVRTLQPGDDGHAITRAAADASAMDTLVKALPKALADAGPATPVPARPASDAGYRFDMQQDGRVMKADEFDAWMKSRRVRVATGKPGQPDPVVAAPAEQAAKAAVVVDAAAPPPPSPVTAAALVAATTPASGPTDAPVVLQVASFANPQNAQHALALLQGADIAGARLHDSEKNGQKIWRLRIGPVASAVAPELAARVVGLGFGQPQRVRD